MRQTWVKVHRRNVESKHFICMYAAGGRAQPANGKENSVHSKRMAPEGMCQLVVESCRAVSLAVGFGAGTVSPSRTCPTHGSSRVCGRLLERALPKGGFVYVCGCVEMRAGTALPTERDGVVVTAHYQRTHHGGGGGSATATYRDDIHGSAVFELRMVQIQQRQPQTR